ncbi:MAG: 4Fe-4S dicluster domain-containing protein [Candidatus Riflebacteria bacterium]|nr:4Fe-4S dicluster domain-containing protein [Candidatus Riflebacteria bacterium]
MKPSAYPPPVVPGEFIAKPSGDADSQLDVGVLFVGAGPAGLAGAIRLAQLLDEAPQVKEALGEMPIVVVEKGRYPGAHLCSGAVVNPIAFKKLFPDTPPKDLPFFGPVEDEAVYCLTESWAGRIPTPPTMANHGNWIASLSQVGRWLGERAEELGVTILNETVGGKLLVDEGVVRGVKVADKGLDRDGKPLGNHEPGPDLMARVTVLAEGTVGHLTQAALEQFRIARPSPQVYALGVKEVWEVPRPLDRVIHTMGWPLRPWARCHEFGGSFAYPMGKDKVSLGLVVGMDYTDAGLSVHDLLQELKLHPLFRDVLQGGQRAERGWGAKTIPEGGYHSLPERMSVPGALIVGDAAGLVNVPSLKGVHTSMWSGILAAEAIFARLKEGLDKASSTAIDGYDRALQESFVAHELREVRNMRQAFKHGFFVGGALACLMTLTRGRFPSGKIDIGQDSDHDMEASGYTYKAADGKVTFDKLSSVHASGNRSRDNQPNHIRVKIDVPETLADTWIKMCPAEVYEWHEEGGKKVLFVNSTNCIHCGAINAKGGRLTMPEGGSGPEYTQM